MGDSIKKWNEWVEEAKKRPFSLERDVINNFEKDFEKDLVVQKVISNFEERSKVGIKKYNTTLEKSESGLMDFLIHLQEELMDATLYIEKIKLILNGK